MHMNDQDTNGWLHWFKEIAQIPRGSTHEKQISDYLVAFANARGLPVTQDAHYNVIITKPASKGMEAAPAVILQGHMDMVCVKEESCTTDFAKDPITIVMDGDTIRADKTSLGADNGIGMAYMLTLLDAHNIPHPPLEAIFTAQEEIGMEGAATLDVSQLTGTYFINMDSEDEGIFCASCAGGRRSQIKLPVEPIAVGSIPQNTAYTFVTIAVKGLKGGHSGMEIDKQRGNSNVLLGRVLSSLSEKYDLYLSHISGGRAANVIPAESSATIFIKVQENELQTELQRLCAIFQNELKAADGKGLQITAKAADKTDTVQSKDVLRKVLIAATLLPHGVIAMDLNMTEQSLVESSNNFAMITTDDKEITFFCASRSSLQSKKECIFAQIKMIADLIGATITYTGDYPSWEYSPASKLRDVFQQAYKNLYKKDAKVAGVHAGLECGYFSAKFKALGRTVDFTAFGPNITGAHTPHEAVSKSSVENMWQLLKEAMRMLGERK